MIKETCSCGAGYAIEMVGYSEYGDIDLKIERAALDDWRNTHRCPDGRYGAKRYLEPEATRIEYSTMTTVFPSDYTGPLRCSPCGKKFDPQYQGRDNFKISIFGDILELCHTRCPNK